MAIKISTLPDEDGDFSEWIEVANIGDETIELPDWLLDSSANAARV